MIYFNQGSLGILKDEKEAAEVTVVGRKSRANHKKKPQVKLHDSV